VWEVVAWWVVVVFVCWHECSVVAVSLTENVVRVKSGSTSREINSLISTFPSNTLYAFESGVYRLNETIILRTGNSFQGASSREKGATTTFTGAILLQAFTFNRTLSLYQTSVIGAGKLSPNRHGPCAMGYAACNFSQELFLDGKRATRKESAESITRNSTEWFLDYNADKTFPYPLVYIGVDPGMRTAELSVLPSMFSMEHIASDIVLDSFVVEKFSSPAQRGALSPSGKNWLVSNVEVRNNHGRGVDINSNATVMSCHIHHNGQMGLGGHFGSLWHSEVDHNNMAGFEHGWEAGGFKFVGDSIKVVGNHVHSNNGTGMWADIGSVGTWYENNTVENNTNAGLSYEISFNGTVLNNVFRGNGFERCSAKGKQLWLWDGQIQIQNSRGSIVRGNEVHVGDCTANAIVIIQQNRMCKGCPNPGQMVVVDNLIEGNKIVMDDCTVPRVGAVSDFHPNSFQNNSFLRNTYTLFKNNRSAQGIEWFWIGGPSPKEKRQMSGDTLSTFQKETSQGIGSRVINQHGKCC